MAALSKQSIEEKAAAVAAPLLEAEGLELLDVEFLKEHEGWILRLTIDRPGQGVGLEDCSLASRTVDTALDVEEVVPQSYHLEVSSPGLNRPLKKPVHFDRALGQRVRIRTFGPIGAPPGRKNFLGILKQVTAGAVTVEVEGAGEFEVPLADVAKANVEFDFDEGRSAKR